ncbi:efflux RND transporter permease subunit [Desmospora activa]|uniref:HAE1 family hydrophobic/amphiphilic exporter-1 n=1 Tax=Desmospora activa DSM 45169 TaxID=1121389 RepID=A0A2T4Z4J5_9BACL|nr:efflux RND transporter permease subunit [Desmospora activa]PTM56813.1 HAE1 family hydrophobic/amphiphilic exporter-1 [Desmospora activa DSM 45169]
MKSIIRFSLNNKFALWLLTLIVAAAGLYAGMTMKLEMIPNITAPQLMVQTSYPGASPDEVAENVTKPIEQRVQNMAGVDMVTSTSMQNVSSVQIGYNFDKDMKEAEDELKETLAKLNLPEGVHDPETSRLSLNEFPILAFSMTSDQLSPQALTEKVENEVVPALEGVDGVASVDVAGQQVVEGQLKYKPDQLKKYGLDENTVNDLIRASAGNYPLGLYTFGDSEKLMEINGEIHSLKELKELEIPAVGQGAGATGSAPMQGAPGSGGASPEQGAPTAGSAMQGAPADAAMAAQAGIPTVKLKQIADIEEVQQAESINLTNGKESIGVQVVKAPDANTVEVVNGINQELDKLKGEIDGLNVFTAFDQGKPIEDSVDTMLNKALIGSLFAFLVILLFLRNFRTTLIAVVSIPLSLVMALLALKQMDITLNVMTLGAMTVAIGRVVDDSIVVIENIYRRMKTKGEALRGKELVLAATREMFVPILSSTLVTVAVFVPLGLVKGPVGELFLPFALTVAFALLASLVVAVTVVPVMTHSLFRKGLEQVNLSESEKEETGRLARGYRRLLNASLNHKWISAGVALILLVGSLFLVPLIGVSFLPGDEEKVMYVTFDPAPGQTEENIINIAEDANNFLQKRDGVEMVQTTIGGGNPMNFGGSDQALFFVRYDEDYEGFSQESDQVIKELEKREDPGTWGSLDMGASAGSNQLELHVYGNDLDQIRPVVDDVMKAAEKTGEVDNVDSSLAEAYEQYTLVPDREALAQHGLTPAQLMGELGRIGERPVLTTIKQDGKDVMVYLETDQISYQDKADLEKKKISTPMGQQVALDQLVKVEEGESPDTVTRRDGKLSASVTMDIKGDDVSSATRALQQEVDNLDLPAGVTVEFGGVSEQITEGFTQLGLAMLAAIAIVYLVLVITFGGGRAPFAILFSLPFTVIGALAALWIAGETISISAMIGALMLIGIVVTNAIVLIDRVIHMENEGLSTRDALLEAAGTRLRPILMTAIATIGALLPLAFGLEGGGLISKGLGVTVIGGLTSSTLLTLIIVPLVYEVLMKKRKSKKA